MLGGDFLLGLMFSYNDTKLPACTQGQHTYEQWLENNVLGKRRYIENEIVIDDDFRGVYCRHTRVCSHTNTSYFL